MCRPGNWIAVFGLCIMVLAASLATTNRAAAQQSFIPQSSGLPNLVGLGIGFLPDYVGSDDYTFGVGPLGRVGFWGERYVELVATEITVNVIDHPYVRVGPVINVNLGRNNVDDAVVDLMEDIDPTVEVGFFAGLDLTNGVDPRIRFGSEIAFLQDAGGVSNGFKIEWSARYWHPLAKWLDLGLVVGTTYGSDSYMDTYFGVSMSDVARSGLPAFSAGPSFQDIRLTPILLVHFSRNWHLGTGIMYKRLLGDAADSPIVDNRGSANQFLFATSLIYSW